MTEFEKAALLLLMEIVDRLDLVIANTSDLSYNTRPLFDEKMRRKLDTDTLMLLDIDPHD